MKYFFEWESILITSELINVAAMELVARLDMCMNGLLESNKRLWIVCFVDMRRPWRQGAPEITTQGIIVIIIVEVHNNGMTGFSMNTKVVVRLVHKENCKN